MAVKTTDTTKPADAKPADPPPAPETPAVEQPARPRVESDCVVDVHFHVGKAVNGKVCSYHAMHYGPDGTRR